MKVVNEEAISVLNGTGKVFFKIRLYRMVGEEEKFTADKTRKT